MSVIIIKGQGDAGKTTTAGYLYQDLLTAQPQTHIFKGKTVTIDSLTYLTNGSTEDFIAILNINGKVVIIISAGDDWATLLEEINKLPAYDILIVSARTGNSVTLRELKKLFGIQIIHTEWIEKQINSSRALKQGYVNSIIAKL